MTLGKTTQNSSALAPLTSPKLLTNTPTKRRKLSDSRSKKGEKTLIDPNTTDTDENTTAQKDGTDTHIDPTAENARLHKLLKRYRYRVKQAKKALSADEEVQDQEQKKLSELVNAALANQLRIFQEQNGAIMPGSHLVPQEKQNEIQTYKEKIENLQKTVSELKSAKDDITQSLYAVKEEKNHLKKKN